MKVLLVGSGGREHALAWRLSQTDGVELHAAPGNPGIAALGECHPVRAHDAEGLLSLARTLDADLVVIGPEAPLVTGVADELRHAGIAVFGPSAAAARIEGSKSFAKEVMRASGVPTAESLSVARPPCVVKLDGLAAGKGVWVCRTAEELDAATEGGRARRRPGADRGAARGRGGVGLRALRRLARAAARAGTRLQAAGRGRRGPEHRRDGLLLAGRRGRRRSAWPRSSQACTRPCSTSSRAAARRSSGCSSPA